MVTIFRFKLKKSAYALRKLNICMTCPRLGQELEMLDSSVQRLGLPHTRRSYSLCTASYKGHQKLHCRAWLSSAAEMAIPQGKSFRKGIEEMLLAIREIQKCEKPPYESVHTHTTPKLCNRDWLVLSHWL